MKEPTTELLLGAMVSAYTEYRALLRSIRLEDGDRAWAKLDRLKEKFVLASRELAEHVLKLEAEETRVPY